MRKYGTSLTLLLSITAVYLGRCKLQVLRNGEVWSLPYRYHHLRPSFHLVKGGHFISYLISSTFFTQNLNFDEK